MNSLPSIPQMAHKQTSNASEAARLMKRFANAQKRARYWSRTPSFSTTARAKATKSRRMHEHYELAMYDQESLAAILQYLGVTVVIKDYRHEELMGKTKKTAMTHKKAS